MSMTLFDYLPIRRSLLRPLRVLMLLLCLSIGSAISVAQEFKANVEINSQKIEGTNRSVFESLKEEITT